MRNKGPEQYSNTAALHTKIFREDWNALFEKESQRIREVRVDYFATSVIYFFFLVFYGCIFRMHPYSGLYTTLPCKPYSNRMLSCSMLSHVFSLWMLTWHNVNLRMLHICLSVFSFSSTQWIQFFNCCQMNACIVLAKFYWYWDLTKISCTRPIIYEVFAIVINIEMFL